MSDVAGVRPNAGPPMKADVTKDIKAAQKLWLPWWAVAALMVVSLPILLLFDHFRMLKVSMPIFASVLALGLVIYIKREHIREPWFWATMMVLVALHVAVVLSVPWTSKWVPASVWAGASSLDFCLMLWVVAAVGRWLGRRSMAAGSPKR